MSEQSTLLKDIVGPNKEERLIGALCYAPFGCFLPTLLKKESKFLSFHAKQGGLIFGVFFILNIIPLFIGLLSLVYIGLAGFAGWKAYNGEEYAYPFTEAFFKLFKK